MIRGLQKAPILVLWFLVRKFRNTPYYNPRRKTYNIHTYNIQHTTYIHVTSCRSIFISLCSMMFYVVSLCTVLLASSLTKSISTPLDRIQFTRHWMESNNNMPLDRIQFTRHWMEINNNIFDQQWKIPVLHFHEQHVESRLSYVR